MSDLTSEALIINGFHKSQKLNKMYPVADVDFETTYEIYG